MGRLVDNPDYNCLLADGRALLVTLLGEPLGYFVTETVVAPMVLNVIHSKACHSVTTRNPIQRIHVKGKTECNDFQILFSHFF